MPMRRPCLRTVLTDPMLVAVSLLIWGSIGIVSYVVVLPWQWWTSTLGLVMMSIFYTLSAMTVW